MASHRRVTLTLTRHFRSLLISAPPPCLSSPQTLTLRTLHQSALTNPHSNPFLSLHRSHFINPLRSVSARRFSSSRPSDSSGEEDEEDDGDGEDGEGGRDYEVAEETCAGSVNRLRVSRKSKKEKIREAAEIGYKVVAPLGPSEKPFKKWEPAFAVVQIGSHQFKVCNGDSIFTERLKYCEVNDKLILNKVLMLGSKTETIIGRPILPNAKVHAVVEEHALDAKVIIFKKKRRKNYRRTKGHRQELTKLTITDVQGIEKKEMKTKKTRKPETVATAA